MSTFLVLISAGYIFAANGLMKTFVYILLYFFCMLGCCQIVGSIQHRHFRAVSLTVGTIVIWGLFLFGAYLIISNCFSSMLNMYYIALGIGFVTSVTSGRIY